MLFLMTCLISSLSNYIQYQYSTQLNLVSGLDIMGDGGNSTRY